VLILEFHVIFSLASLPTLHFSLIKTKRSLSYLFILCYNDFRNKLYVHSRIGLLQGMDKIKSILNVANVI
jgi:hypothetical protein